MKNLIFAVVALATAQVASATFVTVSGNFTATNWQIYFGNPSAPIDPLYLKYSVTFDDELTYTADSSVLSVLSTNIPYSLDFSYGGASSGVFVLATVGEPTGCGHPPSSFCAFVNDFDTGTPSFVEQSPPGGGGWRADTITAVPEPSTWAMLIAGASLVGAAVRRQRFTAAA